MVNPLNEKAIEFKETLLAFEDFLKSYQKEVVNQEGLHSYFQYVNEYVNTVDQQLSNINLEKSTMLMGSVIGLSRYSGEFNWYNDLSFDSRKSDFLSKLIELAVSINEYFENQQGIVDQVESDSDLIISEKFDSGNEYVNEFERKYNLSIPSTYKTFLLKFGGGIPNKKNYYKELNSGGIYDFEISAFYGNSEHSQSLDLGFNYVMSMGVIPEGYLPISDDGVGNNICIGYKDEYLNKIYIVWNDETVKSSDVDPPIPIFIDPFNKLEINKLNGSIISGFGGSVGLELTL